MPIGMTAFCFFEELVMKSKSYSLRAIAQLLLALGATILVSIVFVTRARAQQIDKPTVPSFHSFTSSEIARLHSRAASGSPADELALGVAYEHAALNPDLEQASYWLQRAANHGDPRAQCELGYLYARGQGMPRDTELAYRWFLRAAAAGFAPAQYNLATIYLHGDGVKRDDAEAIHWLEEAAKQDLWNAQADLGILLAYGIGGARDPRRAFALIRRAAKKHFGPAEYNLALAYDAGIGVRPDYEKAANWYARAAEHGSAPALNNLGNMYTDGRGVPHDAVKALELYQRAADGGAAEAYLNLAVSYLNGRGSKQDVKLALQWLTAARLSGLETGEIRGDLLENAAGSGLSPQAQAEARSLAAQWVAAHKPIREVPALRVAQFASDAKTTTPAE